MSREKKTRDVTTAFPEHGYGSTVARALKRPKIGIDTYRPLYNKLRLGHYRHITEDDFAQMANAAEIQADAPLRGGRAYKLGAKTRDRLRVWMREEMTMEDYLAWATFIEEFYPDFFNTREMDGGLGGAAWSFSLRVWAFVEGKYLNPVWTETEALDLA